MSEKIFLKEYQLVDRFYNGILDNVEYVPEEEFLKVLELCLIQFQTKIGVETFNMFRGREKVKGQTQKLGLDNYGPNPNCKSGRANSQDQCVIYLASNIETVIAEIDAEKSDIVNIGIFKINKTINVLKTIINDAGQFDTNKDYNLGYFIILLSRKLCDKKEPDNEDNYKPMRFIANLCRNKGIEGIVFSSSKREHNYLEKTNNINYVFWESTINKLECIYSEAIKVSNNNFEYEYYKF